MLKKIAIVGAVSAAALLSVGGVALADTASPNCSHHEDTDQKSKAGIAGGNAVVRDINAVIAGSIDDGSICPSGFNNNDLTHDHSDD